MNYKDIKVDKSSLRYERKFLLDDYLINTLEDLNSFLPINLFEQHKERRINSVYYDTNDLKFSKQNIDGINLRKKIRVRYYGPLQDIDSPKLELKLKYGLVGNKEIYNLNKNELCKNYFLINNLVFPEIINNKNQNLLVSTKPKLIISYKRKYFLSICQRYRFTLDSNIIFKIFDFSDLDSNFRDNLFYSYHKKILEIKYSHNDELFANHLTRNLPTRLSTVSKYLIALNSLGLASPF